MPQARLSLEIKSGQTRAGMRWRSGSVADIWPSKLATLSDEDSANMIINLGKWLSKHEKEATPSRYHPSAKLLEPSFQYPGIRDFWQSLAPTSTETLGTMTHWLLALQKYRKLWPKARCRPQGYQGERFRLRRKAAGPTRGKMSAPSVQMLKSEFNGGYRVKSLLRSFPSANLPVSSSI